MGTLKFSSDSTEYDEWFQPGEPRHSWLPRKRLLGKDQMLQQRLWYCGCSNAAIPHVAMRAFAYVVQLVNNTLNGTHPLFSLILKQHDSLKHESNRWTIHSKSWIAPIPPKPVMWTSSFTLKIRLLSNYFSLKQHRFIRPRAISCYCVDLRVKEWIDLERKYRFQHSNSIPKRHSISTVLLDLHALDISVWCGTC